MARELIGEDTPAWAWIGFNLLAWLAMTLISPFYSGAGFGLYLNRRTELEAWDIELTFRRLRQRLLGSAYALLLAGIALVLVLPAGEALADEPAASCPVPFDDPMGPDAERLLSQPLTSKAAQDVVESVDTGGRAQLRRLGCGGVPWIGRGGHE